MALLQARFGIQKKLLEEKNHSLSKFQRLFTGTTPFTIFMALNLLVFLLILISSFFKDDFYTGDTYSFGQCVIKLEPISIVLICYYSVLFGTFAVTLFIAKVKEKLGVRIELVFSAVIGVSIVFAIIGVNSIRDEGNLCSK